MECQKMFYHAFCSVRNFTIQNTIKSRCGMFSVSTVYPDVKFNLFTIRYTMGPSIKYVTVFLANFHPPPPVTLRHTSRDPPKVRHTCGGFCPFLFCQNTSVTSES